MATRPTKTFHLRCKCETDGPGYIRGNQVAPLHTVYVPFEAAEARVLDGNATAPRYFGHIGSGEYASPVVEITDANGARNSVAARTLVQTVSQSSYPVECHLASDVRALLSRLLRTSKHP